MKERINFTRIFSRDCKVNRIFKAHQYKKVNNKIQVKKYINFHFRIKTFKVKVISQIFSKMIIKFLSDNQLFKNPHNLKIINKKFNNLLKPTNKSSTIK